MKSRLFALFTVFILIAAFSSCDKEEDTTAEVRVVLPNGTAVAGAEVRMFGQGTTDSEEVGDIRIDETQYTAGNGIAMFDYSNLYVPGQSGFAILNVEITKEYPDSTSYLEGIMQIVEETRNQKTFVLGQQ